MSSLDFSNFFFFLSLSCSFIDSKRTNFGSIYEEVYHLWIIPLDWFDPFFFLTSGKNFYSIGKFGKLFGELASSITEFTERLLKSWIKWLMEMKKERLLEICLHKSFFNSYLISLHHFLFSMQKIFHFFT